MRIMQTLQQQVAFFKTFGYLKLTQAFREEIGWITSEFEQVFVDRKIVHDGTKRSCVVPFIDQRQKLATLMDHPVIINTARAIIGDDFNYLGGDGNFYSGETGWHRDGFHGVGKYIKMAFYLDPVHVGNGALRVIPGSHLQTNPEGDRPGKAEELYGIFPREIPAQILDSNPGDLLIFDHNIMHASFGGGGFRRMFTLNMCRRAETPKEIADLESFIYGMDRFWVDQAHSDVMRDKAYPERMRHLQQVIDHETDLPARAAKCRSTMAEPARG
jgi:hypothetical protein